MQWEIGAEGLVPLLAHRKFCTNFSLDEFHRPSKIPVRPGLPPTWKLGVGSKAKEKMTNIIRALSAAGLSFCSLLILSSTTKAQDSGPQLEVVPPVHHDVSPPLREIHHRLENKAFPINPLPPIPPPPGLSPDNPRP